jgi:hypothetical protein
VKAAAAPSRQPLSATAGDNGGENDVRTRTKQTMYKKFFTSKK